MLGSNIHIDMSGLEKFAKKVDSISGQRKVQMQELLTDRFISSHSKYNNLNSFMSACGIHTAEEFKAFPDDAMDSFVKSNTKFSSWKEMLSSAGAAYYKEQLGL